MEQRFLVASPMYHELQVLLTIARIGPISLPLDPRVLPDVSFEQLPIARMIGEGVLAVQGAADEQVVTLTEPGRRHMRRLAIDYHLELMSLREATDEFFRERVAALEDLGCTRILLYGASDTARAMIGFLMASRITVVGVVDDDPQKQGSRFVGVPVIGAAGIEAMEFDTVVVTTVAFEDEILSKIAGGTRAARRVIGLFERRQPDR